MSKTREITESGLFAAIIAVMIIAAYYIPILGSIMGMLLPIPIIVLSQKSKAIFVIAASIIGIALSGIFVSILSSLVLGVPGLLIGVPMGLAIKHQKSNLLTWLIGTVFAAVGFALLFAFAEALTGITIMDTLKQSFAMSLDFQTELTSAMGELGVDTQASLDDAKKLFEDMLYAMQLLMPAIIIVISIFTSAANLVFSHQVLKRMRIEHKPLGSFDTFRYPKHVAYGGMGMMVLAYLIGLSGIIDSQLITANFAYLFSMIFCIQGLSLIYYFIKKNSGKSLGIITIIILLLLGLQQFISFLGFFDVLMDVRKFDKIKSNE